MYLFRLILPAGLAAVWSLALCSLALCSLALCSLALWCLAVTAEADEALRPKDLSANPQLAKAQAPKKIVFVAGRPSHGYGAHEHNAGCLLLARYLRDYVPGVQTEVHQNGWPDAGMDAFQDADAVVIYCDGGRGHLLNKHIDDFDRLMDQGVGLGCIHYAVEVPKGKSGNAFLEWIGGYFEAHWSVNPHWVAEFKNIPQHPVTRGVRPFSINDEWYFHMRFRPQMKGITPILSAHPPAHTMTRRDGPHSGNPHVRAAVQRGQIQHVAWVAERPNGGRGFGFTGGHVHWNWGDDNFRKVVLNAIVWIAKGEIPADGYGGATPTRKELEADQDFPKPDRDQNAASDPASKRRPHRSAETVLAAAPTSGERSPAAALDSLVAHPDLRIELFAAEPMLLSPSNIDVDHRGRVWVCEIVNYRAHLGKRPEGDRILILEDTDGDGRADLQKVFYQGTDIDSPHGVCVLGNKVVVSAGPHVLCFTDENGDDKPDSKEVWFQGISGSQHDHGIHQFLFGPDGKLYFNFGNEGKQIQRSDGQLVVDMAGHVVADKLQPYQQGMVFRCNLDLSHFETLAWNFRNNWMATVDSFGTIWQSDNDDDGNRGVRINYVMEFGNFGYRDELTGAGWQTRRTGMSAEIPTRHWHLADPGVVPNLLQTGAGSPTGITVYEGDALPSVFRNQILHCDAGPSVARAYIVAPDGAGYRAEIVDLLKGSADSWFRPSDVKIAPDGSLIVADWYDPGVGGHRMGDLDRGRLFRITSKQNESRYRIPHFDFSTPTGAVQALKNPSFAVRYLAWTALHRMQSDAEAELVKVWNDERPRYRARALWLLGKIEGRGPHYVDLACHDADANIRIQAIRLARQLDSVDTLAVARRLATDISPQVRRECAIALRTVSRPEMADVWATLASQHDGEDRWYLEALGIGAHNQWDACLQAWLERIDGAWNTAAGRDIIWRSRAGQTADLLVAIIRDPATPTAEIPRYFRALDFVDAASRQTAAAQLAFSDDPGDDTRRRLVMGESLMRLGQLDPKSRALLADQLTQAVDLLRGSRKYIELIDRFNLSVRYADLLQLAIQHPTDAEGIESIRVLLAKGELDLIHSAVNTDDDQRTLGILTVLGHSADNRAVQVLEPLLDDESRSYDVRREAVRSLAKIRRGAEKLIERAESGAIPERLREAVAADSSRLPWGELRDRAMKVFPLSNSKDNKPLPSVRDLARYRGQADAGRKVFHESGTCAKCHVVDGQGKHVGPDLSEIGSKLSREALLESILYPSAGISHNYETYTLELADGNVVSGVLISQTADEVEIKTSEAVSRRFPRSQIDEITKQPISLMPADLHKDLTEQDLVDLIEFMTTLKKK